MNVFYGLFDCFVLFVENFKDVCFYVLVVCVGIVFGEFFCVIIKVELCLGGGSGIEVEYD